MNVSLLESLLEKLHVRYWEDASLSSHISTQPVSIHLLLYHHHITLYACMQQQNHYRPFTKLERPTHFLEAELSLSLSFIIKEGSGLSQWCGRFGGS